MPTLSKDLGSALTFAFDHKGSIIATSFRLISNRKKRKGTIFTQKWVLPHNKGPHGTYHQKTCPLER
jgi:hypothetical protein